MEKKNPSQKNPRREFIGTVAAGAAALGISSMISPFSSNAENNFHPVTGMDADVWFNQLKGKHKIVFDATRPHEVLPFAWPRVFLMTNEATGTPSSDTGVVVVLRHDAIPYAFENRLWEKYKFGEMFKADDPDTKVASLRNPFWKPAEGAFKVPGIGVVKIGINELQEAGVMFCVCNAAITVYSAAAAEMMKMDAAEVKKDWESGLLPGI